MTDAGTWARVMSQRMPEAAKRGLLSAALRLQQDLMTDPTLPHDRNMYKMGWRAEPTPDGADVYNQTTQGLLIEESARGQDQGKPWPIGKAMITALAEWIKRKGLVNRKVGGEEYARRFKMPIQKRRKFLQGDEGEKDLKGMAWAIARAIQKRGLFNAPVGLQPLRKAFDAHGAQFVEEEVSRELQRSLGT